MVPSNYTGNKNGVQDRGTTDFNKRKIATKRKIRKQQQTIWASQDKTMLNRAKQEIEILKEHKNISWCPILEI